MDLGLLQLEGEFCQPQKENGGYERRFRQHRAREGFAQ